MKTSLLSPRPSRLLLVATLAVASVAHGQSMPGAILTNVSVRGTVGAGEQVLIVGFAIGGERVIGAKDLLIRGVGPRLTQAGIANALADPMISVFSGSREVASNDDWDSTATPLATQNTVASSLRLAPGSRDAALIGSGLPVGTNTVQISGAGGTSGIVVAEVYDLANPVSITATTPRLTNVSCRAQVGTDANLLIAGFFVTGPGQIRLLIRAVGPGLAQFGVPGTLADPMITVFSRSTSVASNDNWNANEVPLATQAGAGAFPIPAGSKDAAVILSLTSGAYTVQVAGVGGTTGVALVEIYELP